MKNLIFVFATTFAIVPGPLAFAQTTQTVAAPSLKQNMKQLSTYFKSIGRTVSDASKNSENAISAQKMIELWQVIDGQTPHFIDRLPEDQKPAALTHYHEMIQEGINLTTQLAEAFMKNDNATAAALVEKLSQLKELGHDTFDP